MNHRRLEREDESYVVGGYGEGDGEDEEKKRKDER